MIVFSKPENIMREDTLIEFVALYGAINIYNFSSMFFNKQIRQLDIFPPLEIIQGSDISSEDFDIKYLSYIVNNDRAFMEFANIVLDAYNGINSIILIGSDDYLNIFAESIQKILYRRYGLVSNTINNPYDINHLMDCRFSNDKIETLDIDRQRIQVIIGEYTDSLPF